MTIRTFNYTLVFLVALVPLLLMGAPVLAQEASCPHWAEIGYIPPNQDELFYSVQRGNIHAKKKTEIRQAALADIATQIAANVTTVIRSEIDQDQFNDSAIIRRRYDETIRTTAAAAFFGEDLHEESCFDAVNSVYWSYVFITKADFAKRMEERQQVVIVKAQARFQSGMEAEGSQQHVLALDNYWAALDEMRDFSAFPLIATNQQRQISLTSAIPNQFQLLAGSIYLEPEAPTQTFKLSQSKTPSFNAYYLQGQKKISVSSLPVKFSVEDEAAEIQASGVTDARGRALCLIEKGKWSAAGIRLRAEVDWQGRYGDPGLLELFNLKLPDNRFAFTNAFLASPLLNIQFSYHSNSSGIKDASFEMNILRGAIVEQLTTAVNARFTENHQEADMQLQIQVNSSSLGEPIPGMRSVRTNLLMQLVDSRTQRVIFAPGSKAVTKAALTDNQALEKTFENLAENLEEPLKQIVVRLGG